MIINLSKDNFDFARADDIIVPVNIQVHLVDSDVVWIRPELHEYRGWWMATASNYLPRKQHVTHRAYIAVCQSRGELVAHIQQHVRPLYQYALNAIDNLDQPDENGCSGLEFVDE